MTTWNSSTSGNGCKQQNQEKKKTDKKTPYALYTYYTHGFCVVDMW
jgi:hypothetical protein